MAGTDSITVLHVEPDRGFAEVTKAFVERADGRLHVVSVETPAAALDRLEGGDVDCIVTAHDLSSSGCLDFLTALQGRYSSVPLVLFSWDPGSIVAQLALTGGVDGILRKRTDLEQYDELARLVVRCVTSATPGRPENQTANSSRDVP